MNRGNCLQGQLSAGRIVRRGNCLQGHLSQGQLSSGAIVPHSCIHGVWTLFATFFQLYGSGQCTNDFLFSFFHKYFVLCSFQTTGCLCIITYQTSYICETGKNPGFIIGFGFDSLVLKPLRYRLH